MDVLGRVVAREMLRQGRIAPGGDLRPRSRLGASAATRTPTSQ
jgi:hypothetical protein